MKVDEIESTNMNITFRKATLADMQTLVKTRIEVLRTVNGFTDNADMTGIENASKDYYLNNLTSENHIGYLIFNGNTFVGTGGISFYQVMPTCDNPTGKKAYIMNMYTRQGYRRKGIASQTLKLLLNEARTRGITSIGLEASDMGRAMYIKFGFIPSENELYLPKDA